MTTPPERWAELKYLTERVLTVLSRQGVLAADLTPADVLVWPRPTRLVIVLEPTKVRAPDRLARLGHTLSAALNGRTVVYTNSRGHFLQVAYDRPPFVALTTQPLDLTSQPGPLHLPVGHTQHGPLWLPLPEADSLLVGGARRMGKTTLLHLWIQAMRHSGGAHVLAWDGKGGVEFGRYAGQAGVHVPADLPGALAHLQAVMAERIALFRQHGVTKLADYNALPQVAPLKPWLVVLDEVAFLPAEASAALADVVARGGAFGMHPVVGIQRPDAQALAGVVRANLSTRLALPCTSAVESRLILGQSGAEKLPKTPGRVLMVWRGQRVEAQAFGAPVLVADGAPAPPPAPTQGAPTLSHPARLALHVAHTELGGQFHIHKVHRALQARGVAFSRERVRQLAAQLEAQGWLTAEQTNAQGHKLGRFLTPAAAHVHLTDTGDLGDSGQI